MAEAYAQFVRDRLDPDVDADSHTDLEALSRGMMRTRALVEALLVETASPVRVLQPRPVDLGEVVRESLELFEPEIRTRQSQVTVGKLPLVAGDRDLLTGLLRNLLINALKYGPRADGAIVVSALREDEVWRVSITSDGPTIPEQDRRRIFQPFRRGYGERRSHGVGLGLAICHRIVERHGGTIGVTPVKSGNRFFFTLPA
jgi:signal transduction histidine kinase